MASHNDLGTWGENVACEKLVAEGCAIMERNWRSGHYEIDIIAQRGDRIIFAEVKTRRSDADDAYGAFDVQKMRRLGRAATAYLRAYDIPLEPQFDFFAVIGTPNDYELTHDEDILMPLSSR